MPNKFILIIDDDPRNIFALKAVLQAKGFLCFSAISAKEGFSCIAKNPEIKLVLMDMMMPEMDGYEAIAFMKRNVEMQHLPVVAITAQAMVGDKEHCLLAGASGYLSKPVNVDDLLIEIKKYLI
ncbi:two-component system cell cycle response regulator DivK [Pedobacter sp. UYEF25]